MTATSDSQDATNSENAEFESASETAQRAGEKVTQEGRSIIQDAREEVRRLADDRKAEAASLIRDVAEALKLVTGKLSDQGHGRVAQYAGAAVDRLQQVSDDLPARDISQLLQQVDDFAHERPALFVGALFVAGFGAARFLKASAKAGGGDYHVL